MRRLRRRHPQPHRRLGRRGARPRAGAWASPLLQFLLTLGGAVGPLLIGVVSDLVGSLALAMLALLPPLFACLVVLQRTAQHYEADAAARCAAEGRSGSADETQPTHHRRPLAVRDRPPAGTWA